MRQFLFILLLASQVTGIIQTVNGQNDTLFNQYDGQGHKQGFWKVKYENGVLKYTGCFRDDKPVGEMKRFFEDGTLKADMFFDHSGITRVKLYYQDGPLAAEGNYLNTTKDSTWNYYSYYTKSLSNRETYAGKKTWNICKLFFKRPCGGRI
jgi:antitoxin component YwqK of YwqJK toxin-antitoxin module